MSFSVSRTKIEPKKPSKKIGNLFSDAWKKGNVADEKVWPLTVSKTASECDFGPKLGLLYLDRRRKLDH